MPVHELAINKHTKVEGEFDQNNNNVNMQNGNGNNSGSTLKSFSHHQPLTGQRREISEPPPTSGGQFSVQASSRKMLITSTTASSPPLPQKLQKKTHEV